MRIGMTDIPGQTMGDLPPVDVDFIKYTQLIWS